MADNELQAKLQKRNVIIDAAEDGEEIPHSQLPSLQVFNPFTEFKEFSRKQIIDFQAKFKQYDVGHDKFIDFDELKLMMEKLGAPQTHLALKEMIREVDEDKDNKISFREFLLIFRKAAAGEIVQESGLFDIYMQMSEIDVDEEGVGGAKNFFEAKINEQSHANKFEAEIRAEQEERRVQEEEKKQRRADFTAKASMFKSM